MPSWPVRRIPGIEDTDEAYSKKGSTRARQLPLHQHPAIRVGTEHLEDGLGNVQPDRRDLSHGSPQVALLKLFPKHIFHKIACIGALVAERSDSGWEVRSLGAAHVEERSEAELIQTLVDRINDLRPCLVSFNGASFDLPVLRYRAMMNRVAAPGLECRWRRRSRPQSRSGENSAPWD